MLIVIFMEGAYVIKQIELEKLSCEERLIRELSNMIKVNNKTKTKSNPLITDDLVATFVTEIFSQTPFVSYLGESVEEGEKDLFVKFQALANMWTDRVYRIDEIKTLYDIYTRDIYGKEKPQLGIALSFIVEYYQKLIGETDTWERRPKSWVTTTPGGSKKRLLKVLTRGEQGEKSHTLRVWESTMNAGSSNTSHREELLSILMERQETDIYMGELGSLYAGFLVAILCTEQEYNKYMGLYETTYKNSCHNGSNPHEYDLEKGFIQTIAHADPKRFEGVPLDAILK